MDESTSSDIKKKAKGAIGYSAAFSALQVLVALFGMVLLIRYFDAEQYAVFALITGLPVALNVYVSLGYDAFIMRYAPSKADDQIVGEIVWSIFWRRAVTCVVVSAVLLLGFDLYADYFSLSGAWLAVAVGQVFVLTEVTTHYLLRGFEARFLQKYVLFLAMFHQGLRVLGIWVGIELGMGLVFFVAIFAGASALNLLCAIVVFAMRHGAPRFGSMLQKVEETAEEKSYRRVNYVNTMGMSFLNTNIDRYILAAVSTSLQVAIYSVATRVLTALVAFYPLQMFRSVAAPTFFAKYDEDRNDADLDRMFRFLFNANTAFGFLAVAIFYPTGDELLRIVFDQPYAVDAYWTLMIFLAFLMFYQVPLALVVKAVEEPKILLISKLSVFVNLALGIPLAMEFGAIGMAVGTLIGNVSKNLIIFVLLRRRVRITVPWASVARGLAVAGTTAALLQVGRDQIALHALVLVPLGGLIYVALMKILPILAREERAMAVSLAPKRLQKLASALL